MDIFAPTSLEENRAWRRWLMTFATTVILAGSALYVSILLIDPFSTGRFTPVKRIDLASTNPILLRAGILRNPRFNAAIFGSSTAYVLNPQLIGGATRWQVAQLGVFGAGTPSQLLVAEAFQRFHSQGANLQIYVLDHLWCSDGDPSLIGWASFPNWLYNDSKWQYLSRILFPESVFTAARRVGIWMGLARPTAPDDGFLPPRQTKIPRSQFSTLARPTAAPVGDAGFPALRLLDAHVSSLPADVQVAFVWSPAFVTMLPVAGSPADARLQACKASVQKIVGKRDTHAYLDLMTENDISTDEKYYLDQWHLTIAGANIVTSAIAAKLNADGLSNK